MKENELIISVINKYEKQQDISEDIPGDKRHNLRRGIKHVISSYLEDITGAFIADILPDEKYDIYVAQTFRFKGDKSQFEPDITIVKKDGTELSIVGFVEVKDSPNPFRWNAKKRQNKSIEYVEKRVDRVKKFRGNFLEYTDHSFAPSVQPQKKKIKIKVNNDVKIDLVLFSDALFSQIKLKELKDKCNGEFIHLHVLLKKEHPNVKGRNIKAENLINKIESDLKGEVYSEKSLRDRILEIGNI